MHTDVAKDDIVGGDPIRRDEKEVLGRRCRVDIPYFAFRKEIEAGKVGLHESNHDDNEVGAQLSHGILRSNPKLNGDFGNSGQSQIHSSAGLRCDTPGS